MNTIEQYATTRLHLHPLQERVYGREPVDAALVESVGEIGIIEPLIIDHAEQIISGSRRWKAATELKLDTVPIRRIAGSDLDIATLLITANRQREKTAGQKAREAAELLRIEKARAAEREKAGVTLGSQAAKGRASDIVAKLTGQSRATVEKQAEIVEKADAGHKAAKEVLDELDAGKMSLAEAYRDLEEWEERQEEEKEAFEWTKEDAEWFAQKKDEQDAEFRAWQAHQDKVDSQRAERLSNRQKIAEQIVSLGVKRLAVMKHPDHGGSVEEMQAINEAASWLREMINTSPQLYVMPRPASR